MLFFFSAKSRITSLISKSGKMDFQNANLIEADFSSANITNANFDGANLNNATWTDGNKCGQGSIGVCNK